MLKEVQVNMLMHMDKFELEELLEKSGYLDNRLETVEFVGFSGSNFHYKTTFYDVIEGEVLEGNVVVYYKNGVIQAEF